MCWLTALLRVWVIASYEFGTHRTQAPREEYEHWGSRKHQIIIWIFVASVMTTLSLSHRDTLIRLPVFSSWIITSHSLLVSPLARLELSPTIPIPFWVWRMPTFYCREVEICPGLLRQSPVPGINWDHQRLLQWRDKWQTSKAKGCASQGLPGLLSAWGPQQPPCCPQDLTGVQSIPIHSSPITPVSGKGRS